MPYLWQNRDDGETHLYVKIDRTLIFGANTRIHRVFACVFGEFAKRVQKVPPCPGPMRIAVQVNRMFDTKPVSITATKLTIPRKPKHAGTVG